MPADSITPGQWLAAFIIAVAVHVVTGAVIWAFQSTPAASNHSPSGVMVSLEAPSIGNAMTRAATPEPVQPAAVQPAPPTPSRQVSGANPVKPVSPEPMAPEPVTPEPANGSVTGTTGSIQPASDIDIPKAEAVTVKPTHTIQASSRESTKARNVPQDKPSANRGSGAQGVSADPTVTYIAHIRSWLSQHKYYPTSARKNGTHGTVRIYLVIKRNGHVLTLSVASSSGSPVLDQAAMAMVRRAEPLPPMPDDMLRTRLEIILPIQYALANPQKQQASTR